MDKSKRHLLTVLKADPADVALRQKVLELTKVLEQFNRDGADAFGAYIPNSFHFMSYNELMAFHAAAFDAANRACVELEQRFEQDRKDKRARARARRARRAKR